MKLLIIEDEPLSADLLKTYIHELMPDCRFLPSCSSVSGSVSLLRNETPDLIFMDIELSDGYSFEILQQVNLSTPIIFTTAYDNFLLQAFEANSIAYLLKPLKREMVDKALQKWVKILRSQLRIDQLLQLGYLRDLIEPRKYKDQFLVKQGSKLIPVKTDEIGYFYGEDNLVYLVTTDKRKYVCEKALTELESLLDPKKFLRVTRKYILAKKMILALDYYAKGQVLIKAALLEQEKIVVSRQQTPLLKDWLNQ